MPRAAGQIDLRKNGAILDATAAVLAERGMAAPIEAIARLAGVSKQTIYNHYGSKAGLVRALVARRWVRVTEPLERDVAPEDLETTLADLARELIGPILDTESLSMMRIIITSGDDAMDLATQAFALGPEAALDRIAKFLKAASDAGLVSIPDPLQAADFFIGMVNGQHAFKLVLKLPGIMPAAVAEERAREAASRFMRAYAPVPAAEDSAKT